MKINSAIYVDPGASYYETRYRERVVKNLHWRAKAFRIHSASSRDAGRRSVAERSRLRDRNCCALSWLRKGAAVHFLVASDPVKKHGPWVVANLRVVTSLGDPV